MRLWYRKKSLIILFITIAIINAFVFKNSINKSQNSNRDKIANVRYIQLEKPTKFVELKINALIEPEDIKWISSPIEGKVHQLLVAPGNEVKIGDILAKVIKDSTNLENDFIDDEKEAKYENLAQSFTPSNLSAAELIFQQARIDAVEQHNNIIHDNKTKGNLISEIEGIVYKVSRPINTSVNQGENIIAIAQKFRVKINIEDKILKSIRNSKNTNFYINTPSKKIPLFYENINQPTDENYKGIKLTALPEDYAVLAEKSNWQLTAILEKHSEYGNFQIPHESIHISTNHPDKWFVWLIDPYYQELIQRPVKIGGILSDQTVISSGLNGGEKLVISAPSWATVGTKANSIQLESGAINR